MGISGVLQNVENESAKKRTDTREAELKKLKLGFAFSLACYPPHTSKPYLCVHT